MQYLPRVIASNTEKIICHISRNYDASSDNIRVSLLIKVRTYVIQMSVKYVQGHMTVPVCFVFDKITNV